MSLPFSQGEFLGVFARYNTGIWPLQIVIALVALAIAALALWSGERRGSWVVAGLAVLWDWAGIVYHWGYFVAISPAAYIFGVAFVTQSALLLWIGVARRRLVFRPRGDVAGIIGGLLVAYALVGYPIVSMAVGHAYPRTPSFGVPGPVTIFTLGLLLWLETLIPVRLLVIPVGWSIVASFAVVSMGMLEDYGLMIAALLALVGTAWKNRRAESTTHRSIGTIGCDRALTRGGMKFTGAGTLLRMLDLF
jgi:hypothetical protein